MLRKILAVLAGYIIFVVSSVLLFNLSGVKPHGDASLSFKIITLVYGITFSVISGYVTAVIAKDKKLTVNYILAIVMATFACISFFTASGSHWTQLFAMFIFAPSSIAGAYLRLRSR